MSDEQQKVQAEEAQPETQERAEAATDQPSVAEDTMQARVAELEAQLAAAQSAAVDGKDQALRAQAEMENIRRRAALDVEKANKFALEKFAGELLPVIDNMERAIEMADKAEDSLKPMIEGVELTLKTLLAAVSKFGVNQVDPQGESFNPDYHQAMSMVENAELAPNTVLAVMQKGYTLNGRLLRPAMVMVTRAPSEPVDTQA